MKGENSTGEPQPYQPYEGEDYHVSYFQHWSHFLVNHHSFRSSWYSSDYCNSSCDKLYACIIHYTFSYLVSHSSHFDVLYSRVFWASAANHLGWYSRQSQQRLSLTVSRSRLAWPVCLRRSGSCVPGSKCTIGEIGQANGAAKIKALRNKNHDTVWDRIRFGFFVCFDSRRNETSFEVKGVSLFSYKDPRYVPTRSQFLRSTAQKLLINYIILNLLTAMAADPVNNAKTYSPRLVPFFSRLNEVTVEQTIVRAIIMIATWLSIYCMKQVLHSFVTIVAVASGLTEHKTWRPLFDSLGDAYTIRHFWRYVPSWKLFWLRLFAPQICPSLKNKHH